MREIEAWLLADEAPFRRLLRSDAAVRLPDDPEAIPDPKRALRDALAAGGGPTRCRQEIYAFFGANIDVAQLRHLPAFCRFEGDLAEAIRTAARLT